MSRVLVVANRTVAGAKVLDAVRERAQAADSEIHLVVPRAAPRHGNVIYDDAQRDAAQVRIDLAAAFLRQQGIEVSGEIGDEDPLTATKDALAGFPADEIIVSTLPQTRSGWLRRDLIERIEEETGRPVLHIETDPEAGDLAVKTTLVVANRTAGGDQLVEVLKKQSERDENRLFLVVIPLEGRGGRATGIARQRLRTLTGRLREQGMTVSGMIGDPDPYDAIMNTLDLFLSVDQIVISTLPETKSGWLRADLISRVRNACGTRAEVEHIVQAENDPAAV
jgi:hypothetical protein